MSKLVVVSTLISVAVVTFAGDRAVALPSDTVDRAVVCSVYAGFAPNTDPRALPAKRNIDHTIKTALAAGERTEKQVNDEFYDAAKLAMYDEPRSELTDNWIQCRDSFAPPDFGT